MTGSCIICGAPPFALHRCRSCYEFLKGHKRDRTEIEMVERNRRRFERDEMRRRYRLIALASGL